MQYGLTVTSATEPIDEEDLEATTILVSGVGGVRLLSQIAQAIMTDAPDSSPAFLAEQFI